MRKMREMFEGETTKSSTVMKGMGMERGNKVCFFILLLVFFTAPSSARSRWHPAKLRKIRSRWVLHTMCG